MLDFVYPLLEFQRTRMVILLGFVILTALGLGLALLLTCNRVRRLTEPIHHLAEAANRIAAGQRGVTVAHASDDEIGMLARSFNDMTHSLETHEAAARVTSL